MTRRRSRESGFAMLLVFLMASVIAITLYMEIPRVAFDSQRQKELLLIERGEQYKRAIQLFVRKNSRYPARLEELESFNNQRYLRRRYKDPITGKDEWRMIHVGPGGVFTDSLTNKPKTEQKTQSTQNFITELPSIGSQGNTGQQGTNPALRRRTSEGGTQTGQVLGPDGLPIQPQPGTAGISAIPGQPQIPGQTASSGRPGMPGYQPGMPGYQPGVPGYQQIPGQAPIPGQAQVPGQTPYPGQPYPGQPQYPGQQQYPGQMPLPGQPISGFPGQTAAQPGVYPGAQAIPGFPGQAVPGQVYPAQMPGMPGYQQTTPGYQGANQPRPGSSGSGGSGSYIGSGTPYIGTTPYVGSAPTPGTGVPQTGRYPGMPGPPVNSQTGGMSAQPYSTTMGAQGVSPPFGQPGMTAGGQNEATRLIQQLLTTPRPGGIPSGNNAGMAGLNIGPGIAGVASTSEAEGILVYNERTSYNEWEFIYDPTKEKRIANPNAAVIGTPADKLGTPAGAQPGSPTPQMQPSQPFGSSPSSPFGGSSGFGSSGGSFGPSGSFGRRP